MSESATLWPQLQQATQGLTFQSETDAPVDPYSPPANLDQPVTPESVLHLGNYPAGTPVKITTLETFFRPATKAETWHNDEEKALVKRFQVLIQLLKDNLTGIKVFKVGTTEMDVYVLGKTKSGEIIGVKTKVVET